MRLGCHLQGDAAEFVEVVPANVLDLVTRDAQLVADPLLGLEGGVLLSWSLLVVPEQEDGTLVVWSDLNHFNNDLGMLMTLKIGYSSLLVVGGGDGVKSSLVRRGHTRCMWRLRCTASLLVLGYTPAGAVSLLAEVGIVKYNDR